MWIKASRPFCYSTTACCNKPEIDRQFRTLPDRLHTFIAGSSMGGLMSLYALLEYNQVFSRAAALSPSLWVAPDRLARLVRGAQVEPDSVLDMEYGSPDRGCTSPVCPRVRRPCTPGPCPGRSCIASNIVSPLKTPPFLRFFPHLYCGQLHGWADEPVCFVYL